VSEQQMQIVRAVKTVVEEVHSSSSFWMDALHMLAGRENLKSLRDKQQPKETKSGDYANYWCGKCIPRKHLRAAGNYLCVERNVAVAVG